MMMVSMISARRVIATIIFVFPIFWTPLAQAEIYRNPGFGVTAPMPKGLANCNGVFDEHDHGFVFFLDSHDRKACDDLTTSIRHRTISLFSSFNATDDTKTLKLFRQSTCDDIVEYDHGTCVSAPRGLRIGAIPVVTLQVNYPDGWIDIMVMAQAGHWPRQSRRDPTLAVNYTVTLRTESTHLKGDLRRFKTTLAGIRFIPAEL
jgi:hypothetical protein